MSLFPIAVGFDELPALFPLEGKSVAPSLDQPDQPTLGSFSLEAFHQPVNITWRGESFGPSVIGATIGSTGRSAESQGDGCDPLIGAAEIAPSVAVPISQRDSLSGLAINVAVADGAGNTLSKARLIGTLGGSQSFTDWVGKRDRNDYYRFDLGQTSSFSANLAGLSADADLQLLSSSGLVLASSTNARSAAESISGELNAGTYFIRVYRYRGNTNYNLTLSATSASPVNPGFSSVDGYGEASVERAIEQLLDVNIADLPNQFSGGLFGLDRIGAPEAWASGYTGNGIVVAVLDTGVDRFHQDLASNLWFNSGEIAGNGVDDDGNGYVDDDYGWNFDGNNSNTLDGNGHGTHVAGTIAAARNGFGVTGVAYDASIMAVKVLSDSGSGSYLNVAQGIRYAVANGADVINLSLGGGSGDSSVRSAIEYAWNQGVAVVMAAGNDGGSSAGYPAAYATNWGIAVGAVNNEGTLASFSNRAGSTVLDYVTAAGVGVTSTTPNNSYSTWSGTSMATPKVAGAMALLIQANRASGRQLTIGQLEQLLMATASNASSASAAVNTTSSSPASLSSLSSTTSNASAVTKEAISSELSDRPSEPSGGAGRLSDAAVPIGNDPVTFLAGGKSMPLSDSWIMTALERSRGGGEDGFDPLTGLLSRTATKRLAGG